MANLNDPDLEAFFRQGDEGTYSGGPGDSIPTGVVNSFDDLDADKLPRLTREQLERRERNKRLVTGLVSVLGVAAVLAFVVRGVGNREDIVVATTPVVTQAAAVAVEPSPAEVAVKPSPAAMAEEPSPATVEPTAIAAADPAPKNDEPSTPPALADRPKATPQTETARAPQSEERARAVTQPNAETAKRSARASEKRVERPVSGSETRTSLPTLTTPMAPVGLGHSSPPTAYFPN